MIITLYIFSETNCQWLAINTLYIQILCVFYAYISFLARVLLDKPLFTIRASLGFIGIANWELVRSLAYHSSLLQLMTSPTSSSNSPNSNSRIRIVQELFNDYNDLGYSQALEQLDAFLKERRPIIIVEPRRLAKDTRRWITWANFMNVLIVGTGSCSTLLCITSCWYRCIPVTIVFGATYVFHRLSFLTDHCINYQIESDEVQIEKVRWEINNHLSDDSIILVHTGDPCQQWRDAMASIVFVVTTMKLVKFLWRQITN